MENPTVILASNRVVGDAIIAARAEAKELYQPASLWDGCYDRTTPADEDDYHVI